MSHKVYSFFIGRWQPFHAGHKALIQTALDRGKDVCIGIRDTQISSSDPYTIKERKKKILKAFPNDRDRIKLLVIPDIDEVLYGRGVGYKVEQVQLPNDIQNISATKIRNGDIKNSLDDAC